MYQYPDIFSSKQRVLFVTAHPDDLVAFFGGLAHQLVTDKKDVFVLLVTNGARGSRENQVGLQELADQRFQEEKNCLSVLGIPEDHFTCLNYPDGEVESNLQLIGDIAKEIRKRKVDLVATHDPSLQFIKTFDGNGYFVQHRDHRKIGEAVIDAVYPYSRDRSFFPEHAQQGLEPHQVFEILLSNESDTNFHFDYTNVVEVKRMAMRAHTSQFDEGTIQKILNIFKDGDRYTEQFQYLKLLW